MTIQFSGVTDIGQKREVNEDSLWPTTPPHPQEASPYGQLFIVADGMGGHGAGDVASSLAIAEISKHYYELGSEYEDIPSRLKWSFQQAHLALKNKATELAGSEQMGTTVVAVVIQFDETAQHGELWVCWAGDSRAYRMRDWQLEQLSQDHSKLWPLIQSGQLTWDEFHFHPERSKVTNSLNVKRSRIEPDIKQFDLLPGDYIMLCSDGITVEVRQSELADTLKKYPQAHRATKKLIELANAEKVVQHHGQSVKLNGGDDNITVLIIQIPGETPPPPPPLDKAKPTNGKVRGGVAVVILLLVVIGGFWLWSNNGDLPATPTQPITQQYSETPTPTLVPKIEIGEEQPTDTPPPATPEPEPTVVPSDTRPPTATRRPTATPTPPPPTATPTVTSIPSPTLTVTLSPTPTSLPKAQLLLPDPNDTLFMQSPITFEWQWTVPLTGNHGFEIRIWPANEDQNPAGIHDAIKSNSDNCIPDQEPCVQSMGEGRYRLVTDISLSAGVQERPGEYLWAVYLVEIITSTVHELEPISDPGRFTYETSR